MNNKNHICFDLDGVLIDSIDLMKYCWENAVKEFNVKHKFEEFSLLIGLPLTSIISILEIPNGDKFIEHYKKLSYQNLDKIKINKDTVDNLKKLSSNYKISIYTSKTKERVEKIIDLFFKSIHFDSILTSDDVLHSKPDPEGLLKICRFVNSTTQESIYVGDTNFDFKASKKAEIDFVYASWGYGEVENFKYKINHIKELTKII